MHARPSAALEGRRVLVVEDEMLIAMELESLLRGQGCAVVGPAATVERALALLNHDQPDAALLDLNLNGHAVTPLAAALKTRGIPFVLVTGYSEAQVKDPELQGAACVQKPITYRGLIRALAQVLDGRSTG